MKNVGNDYVSNDRVETGGIINNRDFEGDFGKGNPGIGRNQSYVYHHTSDYKNPSVVINSYWTISVQSITKIRN